MSIRVQNAHLEALVAKEAGVRGYKSMARTLEDLAFERLRDLHHERQQEKSADRQPQSSAA